jgi:hypothetical protein
MTSMPKISDQMVVQFRRIGKRRASDRPIQAGRTRVVLQRAARCSNFGGPCTTEHGAHGFCDDDGICRINPVVLHEL